jgi:hypothetical protein
MTVEAAPVDAGGIGSTRHGVVLLLASGVSIAAWLTHLVSLASLVDLSERHAGVVWVMHGLTAVTAVTCVGVIALGVTAARRAHASEAEGSPVGRTAFLAWMAIITGSVNLLLILYEGSYVVLLDRHA